MEGLEERDHILSLTSKGLMTFRESSNPDWMRYRDYCAKLRDRTEAKQKMDAFLRLESELWRSREGLECRALHWPRRDTGTDNTNQERTDK
jgi:hypothetical protein